ncbi:MAG: LysR family transcriptional regulator [Verrucomicrobia bacterium]|nr:LysR family transcriptional regulator [Verrucomicrobiota bacterium]
MDTFSLECFVAVAETGSFTKAARKMKRTQSAMTQQIANLEKQLNTRLIERRKKLELTQDGYVFFPYALKMLAVHHEIIDRFKHPELDGEVRVGIPEDFADRFLADVLADFARIHPRIFLNVQCGLSLNLYEQFKNKTLDLVLVKMTSPEDFPFGVEIWAEPLVWVGKPDMISKQNLGMPLPLVLAPEPCVYRSRAIEALEQNNIRWRMVYSSPSYAGTIAAVQAHMGVTVLPITMIPDKLAKIDSLLPPLPDIHVSLIRQSSKAGPAIESLTDFLIKKLKENKHSIASLKES